MNYKTGKTAITLENESGEYSVATHDTMMSMSEMLEEIIIPVLLAAGYGEETIIKAMREAWM